LWYNIPMVNVHFQRKIAGDELRETLFFATGNRVEKLKTPEFVTLRVPNFVVKIKHFKHITVNDDVCRSVSEAKYVIQELIR
jgi:hypothetical protein